MSTLPSTPLGRLSKTHGVSMFPVLNAGTILTYWPRSRRLTTARPSPASECSTSAYRWTRSGTMLAGQTRTTDRSSRHKRTSLCTPANHTHKTHIEWRESRPQAAVAPGDQRRKSGVILNRGPISGCGSTTVCTRCRAPILFCVVPLLSSLSNSSCKEAVRAVRGLCFVFNCSGKFKVIPSPPTLNPHR
jgi:hypothetical protein